jgi:hypothetical protein
MSPSRLDTFALRADGSLTILNRGMPARTAPQTGRLAEEAELYCGSANPLDPLPGADDWGWVGAGGDVVRAVRADSDSNAPPPTRGGASVALRRADRKTRPRQARPVIARLQPIRSALCYSSSGRFNKESGGASVRPTPLSLLFLLFFTFAKARRAGLSPPSASHP